MYDIRWLTIDDISQIDTSRCDISSNELLSYFSTPSLENRKILGAFYNNSLMFAIGIKYLEIIPAWKISFVFKHLILSNWMIVSKLLYSIIIDYLKMHNFKDLYIVCNDRELNILQHALGRDNTCIQDYIPPELTSNHSFHLRLMNYSLYKTPIYIVRISVK